MSKPLKILVLVATFAPIVLLHVLAFAFLTEPLNAHTWLDRHFGYLVGSVMVAQLVVAAFYIWHVKVRSSLPKTEHGTWIFKLLFSRGPFAAAEYWHKHIWRVSGCAP